MFILGLFPVPFLSVSFLCSELRVISCREAGGILRDQDGLLGKEGGERRRVGNGGNGCDL